MREKNYENNEPTDRKNSSENGANNGSVNYDGQAGGEANATDATNKNKITDAQTNVATTNATLYDKDAQKMEKNGMR